MRRFSRAVGVTLRSWHESHEPLHTVSPPRAAFRYSESIRLYHIGRERCWQVSSCGRVCNTRGVISFGTLRRDGYCRVAIGRQSLFVHRLVARSFLGTPPTSAHVQVNHIDGDRSNNSVRNLQYVTPGENMLHSYAKGRRFFSKPVLWRRAADIFWAKCTSQRQVARELGVSQSEVSKCCRGVLRQTSGFEFKFASEDSVDNVGSMMHECSHEVWKQAVHPKTGEVMSNIVVSTLGRISKSGRTSYGTLQRGGYYVTSGKAGWFMVHSLIAATFLGPPSSRHLQVNHIDGNPGNNCSDNLEYVTPSENILHAYSRRQASKCGRGNGKPVWGHWSGEHGKPSWELFPSLAEAARTAKVSRTSVTRACLDRKARSDGWSFQMAAAEEIPGEQWRDVVLG